ncbi:MAG TPA: HK97 gp10 family phage protein [Lacunisphaera sp.]|nr:HK97 gp10 family phage protein [Lacunisphaera sp.]
MDFTVGLDMSRFDRAVERTHEEFTRGIHESVENAAREGAAEAKRVGQFKDRSGDLRAKIHAQERQETALTATWSIVSPQPYSMFVEAGTKPHKIEGNPLLKFYWPKVGAWVALPSVNHPGGRPFPFMGPAAQKAERVLYRDLVLVREKLRLIWKR